MPMSYASAGEPAPAAGTINDETFFKALFDHIFSVYNTLEANAVTRTGTGVAAAAGLFLTATIAAGNVLTIQGVAAQTATYFNVIDSGSAVVFRIAADKSVVFGGAITAAAITAISPAVGTPGLTLRGATSDPSQSILAVTNNAGSTVLAFIDNLGALHGASVVVGTATVSGNATVGGTLAVTGDVTAPHFHGLADSATTATSAATLTAPVTLTGLVSDYKPVVSLSAGIVTVAAGGAYEDSNGGIVGPLTAQNVTLPSQPTGTNTQYVGITLAPGSGAPVVTAAAVNAAESTLLLPTANKPVTVILWRGVTTLPSGIVAAADITDIRNLGGGGGAAAGGSGTDTAVRSSQLLISGTNGIYSAALDVTNAATALRIHPKLLSPGANQGNAADVFATHIGANFGGKISVSGGTLTIAGSAAAPAVVVYNGVIAANTANVSTTVSGAVGLRYILADVSAPPGFTLVSYDSTGISGRTVNQQLLYTGYWDGTTLHDLEADLTNLLKLRSTQVQLRFTQATHTGNDATFTSVGAYTIPTHMGSALLYVPVAMWARVTNTADCNVNVAAANTAAIAADFNGATRVQYAVATSNIGGRQRLISVDYVQLTAGQTYTVSQSVQTVGAGASATTIDLFQRAVTVELFAV